MGTVSPRCKVARRYLASLASILGIFVIVSTTMANAGELVRLPMHRDTELGTVAAPRTVIIAPDDPSYMALARQLSDAIEKQTHVRLAVTTPDGYVAHNPRSVKPEFLNKHFILLGQFWNNAVLERLYGAYYDPTDAFFPGPGGYELRTVCSPFVSGQNCIVATGSDLEGCKKAIEKLPSLILSSGEAKIPFLHEVHMAGEAAAMDAQYQEKFKPIFAELDCYSKFDVPNAKQLSGEDPRNVRIWAERSVAIAGAFGLRYWVTGDPKDGEAFKRFVLGCAETMRKHDRELEGGKAVYFDYGGGALSIAWDLVEETDIFTDAERQEISDFIYKLAFDRRDEYFYYKNRHLPIKDTLFNSRHEINGTFWFGEEGDYLLKNYKLTDQQRAFAQELHDNAYHYLARLSQSYFYNDGPCLVDNEGDLVTRFALQTGNYDFIYNGCLKQLADYWVTNQSPVGFIASNGICGGSQSVSQVGAVLNIASWQYPGEGYAAFRRTIGKQPYLNFQFYMNVWIGMGNPFYNWIMPDTDDGFAKLTKRTTGIDVQPIGKTFDECMREHPDRWQGGSQKVPGRYHYDPIPYEQSWKRLALRTGHDKNDQYVVIDGMQAVDWSYDDINSIVRYDDLGEALLKSQWDAHRVESGLEMNTLFVNNGVPGAKASVSAQLLGATDFGSNGMVRSLALHHDGVAWTRNIFWRKHGWFVIADEVKPERTGEHFMANTWLAFTPFTVNGVEATAKRNAVTLHLVGTPDRQYRPAVGDNGPEGIRQLVMALLTKGQPYTLWTLMYASGEARPVTLQMRRISPDCVLINDTGKSTTGSLVFTRQLNLGGLSIDADMGMISADSFSVSGCRSMTLGKTQIFSSNNGRTFSWDLKSNTFERGKNGFGLQAGTKLNGLKRRHSQISTAIVNALNDAQRLDEYIPSESVVASLNAVPVLPNMRRMTLEGPVRLDWGDLSGNGSDELLLYDASGKARFADIKSINCDLVSVDFDGKGKRDIVIASGKAIHVYHPDGTLRWSREVDKPVTVLGAGDWNSDGREELLTGMYGWGMVFDADGKTIVDRDFWGYDGVGLKSGDFNGDGRTELIMITRQNGLDLLSQSHEISKALWQSRFGNGRCRMFVHNTAGSGIPDLFIGGGGTDLACYDPSVPARKWSFASPVPPADIAMLDIDGDGKPELVGGAEDGFLYVIGTDGKFKFSKWAGAGVVTLAVAPGTDGNADHLIAGLVDGSALILGRNLESPHTMKVSDMPIKHLAVLRRPGAGTQIMAADDSGNSVVGDLEH